MYQIDRPIDWGAVTDHSEYFGELGICTSPNMKGRFSLDCKLLLGFGYQPGVVPPDMQWELTSAGFNVLDFPVIIPTSFGAQLPLCTADRASEKRCAKSEMRVWDQVQAAADEETDWSRDCTFTAFRAYENTSTPNASNWHRNVIFKNEHTIPVPISAVDLSQEPNPDPRKYPPIYNQAGGPDLNKLFDGLQDQCLDAGGGCDVLVIPHNSNVGPQVLDANGDVLTPSQWHDPKNAEEAAKWKRFQPLVEIHQIKGTSECRFDPRFDEGVDTTDEDCAFELLGSTSLSAAAGAGSGSAEAPADTDTRTMVRNVLKAGLQIQDNYYGINPFKVGFVGATDNHNGTMGWNPETEAYFGHEGIEDYQSTRKINSTQNNSGGVGVVWAEQNTRDAIFEALARKETYATSGMRPIVRFFGGWEFDKTPGICGGDFVRAGYRDGVPMGGDMPNRPTGESPDFIVSAAADDFIGEGRPQATPLQKVQIIKGWFDYTTGETHEKVYTVARGPNGAGVDEECGLTGSGHQNLCTVWSDPEFNAEQRAFYYARVIENPVCRYSTRICQNRFDHPVNVLFKRPGETRITQLHFRSAVQGDALRMEAEALLRRLQSEGVRPEEAKGLVEASVLPRDLPLLSDREIARYFGNQFTQALSGLLAGFWHGPVESSYGLHLVYVHERTPARVPELSEIRAQVVTRTRQKLADDWLALRPALLRKEYQVVMPWGDA